MATATIADNRKVAEAVIDAASRRLAGFYSQQSFKLAFDHVVGFFRKFDEPEFDEDGEPYVSGGHWQLCYRLACTMKSVGFDPKSEEGGEYLMAAANEIHDHILESDDPELCLISESAGDQLLETGEYLSVDLIGAEVIVSDSPIHVTLPIRRESPKVKRNDLCACGSGRKHKRCSLKGLCPQDDDLDEDDDEDDDDLGLGMDDDLDEDDDES